MSLITCPECKQRISDTAVACPKCGYALTPEEIARLRKTERQVQTGSAIGCFVFVIIILFLFYVGSLSSGGETSGYATPTKIDAWVMAKQYVRENLKSPGSADFGSLFSDYQDPDAVVTDLGDGRFRIVAWVDAQNAFGAKVRTYFICEIEHLGNDRWRLISLDFTE